MKRHEYKVTVEGDIGVGEEEVRRALIRSGFGVVRVAHVRTTDATPARTTLPAPPASEPPNHDGEA